MSGKRILRYGGNLSLRKPVAVIHQNVQVMPPPPPGFDDEGRLPKSLPPTPVVDLITEDEEEVERTPQHRPIPDLDNQAIEDDAATSTTSGLTTPLPLRPIQKSGGKNLAVLASTRESPDSPSSASSSPASAASSPHPSPTPSQSTQGGDDEEEPNVILLLEEERRRVQTIEQERRRLENGKRRLQRLLPKLKRRKEVATEEIVALRRHLEIINKSLEERVVVVQEIDYKISGIEDLCN